MIGEYIKDPFYGLGKVINSDLTVVNLCTFLKQMITYMMVQ